MWVTVRLLADQPEQIGGGWYAKKKQGAVTDYPDCMAARLVAEGSAELVEPSDELSEHLTKLAAEIAADVVEEAGSSV
jgi:hypothetical protein